MNTIKNANWISDLKLQVKIAEIKYKECPSRFNKNLLSMYQCSLRKAINQ